MSIELLSKSSTILLSRSKNDYILSKNMIKKVYSCLTKRTNNLFKNILTDISDFFSTGTRSEFIKYLFSDDLEFENYSAEFENSVAELQSRRINEFYQMVPESQATFGGMSIEQARCLYAIVRVKKPRVIVETGVCNGVSTLVILMAMDKNNLGTLYSIDYPTFSDDPAPKFQKEQYPSDHTFSAIPKGRSPGWIIPDHLRERWELRIGKSQQKLPSLLNELENIDIFIHDSDHTFPCMMFEYEIAWEYLKSDGVLLSDDINTNDAFTIFGELRTDQYGEACSGFGYALKSIEDKERL